MAQIIDIRKSNLENFTVWMHQYIELPRGSYEGAYSERCDKKQVKNDRNIIIAILQVFLDRIFPSVDDMVLEMKQYGVNINDPIIVTGLKYAVGDIDEDINKFNLKRIVKEKGLTAYKIGKSILEPTAVVHEWMNGKSIPSFFQCNKLGRAIGVDPEIVLAHFGHGKLIKRFIFYRMED